MPAIIAASPEVFCMNSGIQILNAGAFALKGKGLCFPTMCENCSNKREVWWCDKMLLYVIKKINTRDSFPEWNICLLADTTHTHTCRFLIECMWCWRSKRYQGIWKTDYFFVYVIPVMQKECQPKPCFWIIISNSTFEFSYKIVCQCCALFLSL